jgi:hypothetical protein
MRNRANAIADKLTRWSRDGDGLYSRFNRTGRTLYKVTRSATREGKGWSAGTGAGISLGVRRTLAEAKALCDADDLNTAHAAATAQVDAEHNTTVTLEDDKPMGMGPRWNGEAQARQQYTQLAYAQATTPTVTLQLTHGRSMLQARLAGGLLITAVHPDEMDDMVGHRVWVIAVDPEDSDVALVRRTLPADATAQQLAAVWDDLATPHLTAEQRDTHSSRYWEAATAGLPARPAF